MKVKDTEVGLVVAINSEPGVGMTVMKLYNKTGGDGQPALWVVDMVWLDCEAKPHMLIETPVEAISIFVPRATA